MFSSQGNGVDGAGRGKGRKGEKGESDERILGTDGEREKIGKREQWRRRDSERRRGGE